MSALTGNTVASSYQGLLKTLDNASIDPITPKQISDGSGGSLPIEFSQVQTNFLGSVDFSSATVTGLPGGSPGLVAGSNTNTMVSSASLTTTQATADSDGNIALGNNARALGGGGFTRTNISLGNGLASNERTIAMGHNPAATGSRAVAIGEQSSVAGGRAVGLGQNSTTNGFNSVVLGAYSSANGESAFAVGGYNAVASAQYSGALGREVTANLTGGIAIGYQVTTLWAYATTVNQLAMKNYAAIDYADDTAAAAGGVPLGGVYHTSGTLKIRVA